MPWVPRATCSRSPSTFRARCLPKSFHSESAPIADAGRTARTSSRGDDRASATTATNEESANVPAGYAEETPAEPETVSDRSSRPATIATAPSPRRSMSRPRNRSRSRSTGHRTSAAAAPRTDVHRRSIGDGARSRQSGAGGPHDRRLERRRDPPHEGCELREAVRPGRGAHVRRSLVAIDRKRRCHRAAPIDCSAKRSSDAHTRNEIARIVSIWIESPHRKTQRHISRRHDRAADRSPATSTSTSSPPKTGGKSHAA